MLKKILSLALVALLAAAPLTAVALHPPGAEDISSFASLERYLQNNLPLAGQMQDAAAVLLLQSGQTERDNVFRTDDGLLENYWPTAGETVRQRNLSALTGFAESHDVPVCAVVIPTAAAVKQKLLPDNAPLYNQKEAIADIGRAMEGKVTVADVYATLYQCYNENEEYLYYRTDPRMTTLGGYRVYAALAERLRLTPQPLRGFSKEYLVHDYYGELTESWGENQVQADILAVYRSNEEADCLLEVTRPDGESGVYQTMYPTGRMEEDPFSIFLGGESAWFELENAGNSEERLGRLLVFGDSSVQSFLPFLAWHYSGVTYCNLALADAGQLRALDVQDYDQVLFAYGLASFCDSAEVQRVRLVD